MEKDKEKYPLLNPKKDYADYLINSLNKKESWLNKYSWRIIEIILTGIISFLIAWWTKECP